MPLSSLPCSIYTFGLSKLIKGKKRLVKVHDFSAPVAVSPLWCRLIRGLMNSWLAMQVIASETKTDRKLILSARSLLRVPSKIENMIRAHVTSTIIPVSRQKASNTMKVWSIGKLFLRDLSGSDSICFVGVDFKD